MILFVTSTLSSAAKVDFKIDKNDRFVVISINGAENRFFDKYSARYFIETQEYDFHISERQMEYLLSAVDEACLPECIGFLAERYLLMAICLDEIGHWLYEAMHRIRRNHTARAK